MSHQSELLREAPRAPEFPVGTRRLWITYLGFVLPSSIALFLWFFGSSILDPSNIDWLMDGADRATHYLGWLAMREDAWRFPLGRTELILSPIGTSTGMTESATLLAVLFKAFIPLGRDFQYSGIWLLLCHAALSGMAFRFLVLLGTPLVAAALGGLLVSSSAPLLLRFGHVVLCAHWILIWAFVLFAKDRLRPSRWGFKSEWLMLFLVVTGLNPYLTAMTLSVFIMSQAIRAFEAPTFPKGMVRSTVAIISFSAAVFGLLGIWGYFQRYAVDTTAGGFGTVSSNLNTFFNSLGMSEILPGLPSNDWQWEGYGYFGAGGLVLISSLLISLGLSANSRLAAKRILGKSELLGLFALSAGAFVYAVGPHPNFGKKELADLSILYEPFSKLTGTFRSSGRFIWIPYYFIFLVTIAILARSFCTYLRPRALSRLLSSLAFGTLLCLQVYDLSGFRSRLQAKPQPFRPFLEDQWPAIRRDFEEVIVFPPKIFAAPSCVPQETPIEDFQVFVHMALLNGMSTNSGYVGRPPKSLIRQECVKVRNELFRGDFRPRTLYILDPNFASELQLAHGTKMMPCAQVDGYAVCSKRSNSEDHFSKWLERAPKSAIPPSAVFRLDRSYDQTLLYTNLFGLTAYSHTAGGRAISRPTARISFGPAIPAGSTVTIELTRTERQAPSSLAPPNWEPFPVLVRVDGTEKVAIFESERLTVSHSLNSALPGGSILELEIPEAVSSKKEVLFRSLKIHLSH